MSQQIDAIFDHGVLKPLGPLNLPDQAHVRVTVDQESKDAGPRSSTAHPAMNQDFDSALEPLLFDGPSLPADFSRADIYADHD